MMLVHVGFVDSFIILVEVIILNTVSGSTVVTTLKIT